MLSKILKNGGDPVQTHNEGELFKRIELYGSTFDIRYGYYEDIDRQYEPYEVYPDFIKNPVYTSDGAPFVTLTQTPCAYFQKKKNAFDGDCGTCIYMEHGDGLIAVCRCPQNRKESGHE